MSSGPALVVIVLVIAFVMSRVANWLAMASLLLQPFSVSFAGRVNIASTPEPLHCLLVGQTSPYLKPIANYLGRP
jgi:hypothetical protein